MPHKLDMRHINSKDGAIIRADAKRCALGHLLDTYKGVEMCRVCNHER